MTQDLGDTEERIKAYINENQSSLWPFSNFQSLLPKLEEIVGGHVDRALSSLDETRCADLVKVISDRRAKVPTRTGYLDGIVSTCGQILTFGAGGLALAVGFADKLAELTPAVQRLLYAFGVFYSELVILSLLIVIMYLAQARFRYPFIYFDNIGNAWPYFYYASISPDVDRNLFQTAKTKFKDAGLYAADLVRFTDRCVNETSRERLRSELQQYFLIMAYSGYTQQFGLRLANIFLYGLAGATVSAIVLFYTLG